MLHIRLLVVPIVVGEGSGSDSNSLHTAHFSYPCCLAVWEHLIPGRPVLCNVRYAVELKSVSPRCTLNRRKHNTKVFGIKGTYNIS